jgi:hypothetical protein
MLHVSLCPVNCYASLSNVPPFIILQVSSHLVLLFLIVIIFSRQNHFIMGAVGQCGSRRKDGRCEHCHHHRPWDIILCCQYSGCACVRACMRGWVHVCTRVCVCVRACIHVCMCMHLHACAHICVCVCVCVCVCGGGGGGNEIAWNQ